MIPASAVAVMKMRPLALARAPETRRTVKNHAGEKSCFGYSQDESNCEERRHAANRDHRHRGEAPADHDSRDPQRAPTRSRIRLLGTSKIE